MIDYVFDATIVWASNGALAGRRAGNALDRRLRLLEEVLERRDRRVRYNPRLMREYTTAVQEYRNDVIELFMAYLDSPRPARVPRNTLARQLWAVALRANWPRHDQHLLAAALGGKKPHIYVTEAAHSRCAAEIKRKFKITVIRVA